MAKRNLRRNKKGSLQDILFIGIALLILGVSILFGYFFVSEINDHLQANDVVPTRAKSASTSLTGQFTTTIDNSFLFLALGLGMITLIFAALVRIHPIFIPFFLS